MSDYGYHTEFVIDNLSGGKTRLSYREGDGQEHSVALAQPAIPAQNRDLGHGNQVSGTEELISGANKEHSTAIDELMRAVAGRDEKLRTTPFRAGQLQVRSGALVDGDTVYQLRGDGLRRFCNRVRAPFEYLIRLDEPLRDQILQHHVDRGDYRRKNEDEQNLSIISRDGEFLAVGRSDLNLVGTDEVLAAVLDAINGDAATLQVHAADFSNDFYRFELVSPVIADEVSPGDVIRGGLRISHSPIGEHATVIETFLMRLVCSNGMIHRECVRQRKITRTRRLPADRADARSRQINQISRLAAEIWGGLRSHLEAIRQLKDEHIDDVTQLLAQFLRRARLHSGKTMELLDQAWKEDGALPTAFAALNALTRVATHSTELSSRQRLILSRLAGVLANRDSHICPSCFSVISHN